MWAGRVSCWRYPASGEGCWGHSVQNPTALPVPMGPSATPRRCHGSPSLLPRPGELAGTAAHLGTHRGPSEAAPARSDVPSDSGPREPQTQPPFPFTKTPSHSPLMTNRPVHATLQTTVVPLPLTATFSALRRQQGNFQMLEHREWIGYWVQSHQNKPESPS